MILYGDFEASDPPNPMQVINFGLGAGGAKEMAGTAAAYDTADSRRHRCSARRRR
jgi:hypothetical protein